MRPRRCQAIASCTGIPHIRCACRARTRTGLPEEWRPRPWPRCVRAANRQLPSGIRNMPHGYRRKWARARRNPLRACTRQRGSATTTTTTTVSEHASVAAANHARTHTHTCVCVAHIRLRGSGHTCANPRAYFRLQHASAVLSRDNISPPCESLITERTYNAPAWRTVLN